MAALAEECEPEGDQPDGVRSSSVAVAPVMTIDSPRAMITNSWKRSAKWRLSTSHATWSSRGKPGTR